MEVDEPTCQAGPSQPSSQGELTSTVKQAASSNAGGKTRAYGSVKEDDVDESDSGGSQSGYDSDNESEDEEDVGPPDPLYDPEADDEDEKFVAAQRSGRESDAILNCPGCFTTVCIDCQQHAKYHHQFRAMFAMNVNVDHSQQLRPAEQQPKQSGRKRHAGGETKQPEQQGQGEQQDTAERYHPVSCDACGTELIQEEEKLRKMVKKLEDEMREASQDKQRKQAKLDEMLRKATELQGKIDQLQENSKGLQKQNKDLKDDLKLVEAEQIQLSHKTKILEEQQQVLCAEKEDLAKQVESLKQDHANEIRHYQTQLDELRTRVSDIVTRMLSHALSEAEGVAAVKALGCDITYIGHAASSSDAGARKGGAAGSDQAELQGPAAARAVEWGSSSQALLLEDRGRLERLVAAGMAAGQEAARIPMITFPNMRLPTSHAHLRDLKLKLPGLVGADGSQDVHRPSLAGSADVAGKDQAPSSASSSASSKLAISFATSATPSHKPASGSVTGNGIKFVYALQGGKGTQWVSKVPVQPEAPPPHSSHTRAPVMLADRFQDNGSLTGMDKGFTGLDARSDQVDAPLKSHSLVLRM